MSKSPLDKATISRSDVTVEADEKTAGSKADDEREEGSLVEGG